MLYSKEIVHTHLKASLNRQQTKKYIWQYVSIVLYTPIKPNLFHDERGREEKQTKLSYTSICRKQSSVGTHFQHAI